MHLFIWSYRWSNGVPGGCVRSAQKLDDQLCRCVVPGATAAIAFEPDQDLWTPIKRQRLRGQKSLHSVQLTGLCCIHPPPPLPPLPTELDSSRGLIRGVWYSHLFSGSQEAWRSPSWSLDEVTAPVGSAAERTQQNKWTAGQKNQLAR